MSDEAQKHDSTKLRVDLLPVDALESIAEIMQFGAAKYGEHNWRKGMQWSRLYAACLRHLWAWWRGEDTDPESGLAHLAHAACCIMFLIHYTKSQSGADDRFRYPQSAP